jgi:Putative phage metallopeptidase
MAENGKKTVEVSEDGRGPRLAIFDEDFGPRIKAARVLMPKEVNALDAIKQVRARLETIDALDQDMKAKLEAALDKPSELEELTGKYLDEDARMRLGVWGEGDASRRLEEAELILDYLIGEYRPELRPFQIAVVAMEKVTPVNRRGRLGTAFKMPGKMKFLAGVDGIVTIGFQDWRFLSDRDRQRLVHHEIEHFEVDTDGGTRRLLLKTHDFEEFISIAVEYGLRSESGRFNTDGEVADALAEVAGQLELLAPTLPNPKLSAD